MATEVAGLSRADQRITCVKNIDEVWTSFSLWVQSNIAEDEVGEKRRIFLSSSSPTELAT